MLPKHNRLTKKMFTETFRDGVVFHTPHIMAKLLTLKSETSHYGVVVSKKIAKKAVDRNALRRKFYGIIEEFPTLFRGDMHGIFIVKKGISNIPRDAIKKELGVLLKQAGQQ